MSSAHAVSRASELRVEPLAPHLLATWSALFEACSCACHCRYWHFSGTKNDWLARCAFSPEESRREHEEATRRSAEEARGLVALLGPSDAPRAVGWMKLTPRSAVPKLRGLSVYRAHDLGHDDGVYSVGCFLVHPEHRKTGVARALLTAAPRAVRAWGGSAIEAYPRESSSPLSDEEAFLGPVGLYRELGYAPIGGESPYPVVRLVLDR